MMNPKSSLSVLVLDDDLFILKTTHHALTQLGFNNIITAHSVHFALEQLGHFESIDIILMDLNMPETDGIEFFRTLEIHNFLGGIILISGEDEQTLALAKDLAKARKLNIIGTIAKPLNNRILQTLLSQWAQSRTPVKEIVRRPTIVSQADLQSAIDAGELEPWFQPMIQLQTGEVTGVEMLARWPKIDGYIYPDEFIPLAEASGLINPLTFLLIKKASYWLGHWKKHGLHLRLAINISMNSLHDLDFPDQFIKTISDAGVDPNDIPLTIEVTESSLAEDLSTPLDNLLRLRMKKIGLSIDDFGTGWSNLTQLQGLPFTELKLDLSFVQGAATNSRTRTILESTVKMAKHMGMTTVAEGIETKEELEYIKGLGCDLAQGYFMARPMPGGDILNWTKNWKKPE
tara:strand:- start:52932 stop:54137 length:1206 start_codon:yes stop_codon:yes gene_type:complete